MLREQEEFIWTCGLFEGEGHVSHRRNKSGYMQRVLELGSTDLDVLERAHRALGVGRIYGPKMSPTRKKPFYVWRCSHWADLEPLLTQMLPWLGARRHEAAVALLADPPTAGFSTPGKRPFIPRKRRPGSGQEVLYPDLYPRGEDAA